jgi:CheY-like chemotaxis protein
LRRSERPGRHALVLLVAAPIQCYTIAATMEFTANRVLRGLADAWKALILVSAPLAVLKALEKVFATLGLPYDLVDADAATIAPSFGSTIGLLAYQGEEDFKRRFLLLDSLGAWSIIVLDDSCSFEKIRQSYPPEVRQEAEMRCIISKSLISQLCGCLQEVKNSQTQHVRETAVTRFFRAENILELTELFGHDSHSDITNSVLGPARMLTEYSSMHYSFAGLKQQQKEILEFFEERVVKRIVEDPNLFGELGSALVASFGYVSEGIKIGAPQDRRALLASFDTLLSCLTQARELAGRRIIPCDRPNGLNLIEKAVKPDGQRSTGHLFRVLVVDDFAATWRPVIKVVCEQLKMEGLPTVFEFSVDGRNVSQVKGNLVLIDEALPSYDLVLLDIFLGEENGLQLLSSVRERFLWLPVILWTTSVASELPAQAQLANGFIFKKRDNLDHVVSLLKRWLPEGRARRDAGLSSRLFDTTLRSPGYRQCAISFEKTCLKILDSFHALDNSFFRLYTDHGGRHIRTLLLILEQLVNPFLLHQVRADGVFSPEAAVRERELLQLYLAVLCHEVGMFPLRTERRPPTNDNSLEAIRATHPVRGMMALVDEEYRPEELAEAIRGLEQLGDGEVILMAVGVLTGYHARLLDIGKENFLRAVGAKGELKLKEASDLKLLAAGAEGQDNTVVPEATIVVQNLGKLETLLFGSNNRTRLRNEPGRERLRKHCALLRFADALDVDRTRTPLGFLLLDPHRNHLNIREHVKREVLEEVEFGPRGIRLHFNAPKPDHAGLSKLFGGAVGLRSGLLAEPWHSDNRESLRGPLQRELDRWLASYWLQVLLKGPLVDIAPDKREELVEEWDKCAHKFELTLEELFAQPVRALVASATALSVAGEILDEYSAIEECGLELQIKLDEVTWKEPVNWERLPLLNSLSIVRE